MSDKKDPGDQYLRALGYQEGIEHVARTMLRDKLPLCTISRYTGIDIDCLKKKQVAYKKA